MLKKVSKKTLASLQLFRSCSVIFPEEAEALDAALRARPERVCVQRQAFKNVAQCAHNGDAAWEAPGAPEPYGYSQTRTPAPATQR